MSSNERQEKAVYVYVYVYVYVDVDDYEPLRPNLTLIGFFLGQAG